MTIDFYEVNECTLRTLPLEFYERDPHELARDLLGRDLVRLSDDGPRLSGRILEVEVYGFDDDPASHANTGVPTDRTTPMFGDPGTAYVYQIYGMYHCLNVVAPADVRPSALLIRALHPLEGLHHMADRRGLSERFDETMPLSVRKKLLSGPGKICQAMDIGCPFNQRPFDRGKLLLTQGVPVSQVEDLSIASGTRIGLNPKTVGAASEWPWRYGVRESKFLSRPL
jgi:DNA-3-methyladenine glycosylase